MTDQSTSLYHRYIR